MLIFSSKGNLGIPQPSSIFHLPSSILHQPSDIFPDNYSDLCLTEFKGLSA
ncbi:hypothetical protein SAMN04487900_12536 [Prevotella communis]|uniref:Uncharacterized protein n=1 Tax=Prevotella communis TaxID=2913614 RepID=A0A1H0KFH4_9BACT|nr:hypothetical protein SAMN04487900_12536 [Prevotella communis]